MGVSIGFNSLDQMHQERVTRPASLSQLITEPLVLLFKALYLSFQGLYRGSHLSVDIVPGLDEPPSLLAA